MNAKEKFENRLRELGLYDEWLQIGALGKVGTETEENVIIFVHEDDEDKYSECTFPPMWKMSEDDGFRRMALREFVDAGDEKFIRALVRWFFDPKAPCPLFPVDVYFLWDFDYKDFEDDTEENIERYEEWCADCDHIVDIANDFRVQKCPNCGKWLVPCSICPLENCSKHCPLERYAIILNGE